MFYHKVFEAHDWNSQTSCHGRPFSALCLISCVYLSQQERDKIGPHHCCVVKVVNNAAINFRLLLVYIASGLSQQVKLFLVCWIKNEPRIAAFIFFQKGFLIFCLLKGLFKLSVQLLISPPPRTAGRTPLKLCVLSVLCSGPISPCLADTRRLHRDLEYSQKPPKVKMLFKTVNKICTFATIFTDRKPFKNVPFFLSTFSRFSSLCIYLPLFVLNLCWWMKRLELTKKPTDIEF